ncbi:MAG TPA: non-canonical purine NTP pyrophosphatase, partial [Atribacterota bacterium]|nr:non-canonical purine NTP pyrophosphatase [Atribacterota bacterium]
AMCLVIPGLTKNNTLTSEGFCYGKITNLPKGDAGFGYDPIFMPDGYNLTFSQLGVETKNKISHRAKALDEILPQIIAYFQLK